MIRQIARKDLDTEKYTDCLEQSLNYRLYAEVWYLDVVADGKWDCLVYNDYDAVMPLPYRKKFGIKHIAQPPYCQQLGVFHKVSLDENLFEQFEKKLHRKLVRAYHFNEENTAMFVPKGEKRINQILALDFEYEVYLNSLRKNRKQELRAGLLDNYKITESATSQSFLKILEQCYQHLYKQIKDDRLQKLTAELQERHLAKTIEITHENIVVASSLYVYSKHRIIQLINAKLHNTNHNFNTHIVNYMIKTHLNQEMILDFEGSTLQGVNAFNNSMRAITQYYTSFSNLHFIEKMLYFLKKM